MLASMRRKRNHQHWEQECKLGQPLWKRVWRVLTKLKIELRMIQQLHSWVHIQSKNKNRNNNTHSERYMQSNVYSSIIYNS